MTTFIWNSAGGSAEGREGGETLETTETGEGAGGGRETPETLETTETGEARM